jgi:hypothetical protein
MSRGLVMTFASIGIAVGIVLMILGNLWIGLAVIAFELLITVPFLAMRD